MKYENITQAASLSPRVLKKAEKREPVSREFHVCKGCKEGGLLPWLWVIFSLSNTTSHFYKHRLKFCSFGNGKGSGDKEIILTKSSNYI